jgi:hypothetical protein
MRAFTKLCCIALFAAAVGSCSDAGRVTAPDAGSFARLANPEISQTLIAEITAAITCLYAEDSRLQSRKLRDFERIVALNTRTVAQAEAVRSSVNNFVRDSERAVSGLSSTCDGTPVAVAAQELYNALYLLSGQTEKIEAPDSEGDAGVAVFTPGEELTVESEGAAVHVPADAFDVSVLISWRQITESTFDPDPFTAAGTPIDPPYEFTVTPNITANGEGWGRYICVSHEETEMGELQLFRDTGNGVQGIPSDERIFLCEEEHYGQISNPLLRGMARFASAVTSPFRPKLLYALQHAAIGGPDIIASPHMVVRLAEVEPEVAVGVNSAGQLNKASAASPSSGTGTTTLGVRYLPTNAEGVAPGCECEGWGVADATTGVTGYANQSQVPQTYNITVQSFTETATTAVSVVTIDSTFEVTHSYYPSPVTPNLYEVEVAIKNISANTIADLRYRRVVDWDVEPTAFDEFITIKGTSGPSKASAVLFASDNGFASADPLSGESQILFSGDATNSGPTDHGALFDFGFGSLAPGATKTFKLYYGAAGSESAALTVLGAVGAEVYSLAKPNVSPFDGTPNTFILAFTGVGGTSLVPSASLNPTFSRAPLSSVGGAGVGSPRSGTPDPRNVQRR